MATTTPTMTITEALHALHRAGRIRSPWLPGMMWSDDVAVGYLCLATDAETIRSGSHGRLRPNVEGWNPVHVSIEHAAAMGWRPVVSDPATVGCLLALLREAEGDPGITTRAPADPHGGNWYVHVPGEDAWATDSGAPTEGEAIASALIALAGAP